MMSLGQLCTSFIYDLNGVFGTNKIPFSVPRLLGIIIVFIGSVCVNIRLENDQENQKNKTTILPTTSVSQIELVS